MDIVRKARCIFAKSHSRNVEWARVRERIPERPSDPLPNEYLPHPCPPDRDEALWRSIWNACQWSYPNDPTTVEIEQESARRQSLQGKFRPAVDDEVEGRLLIAQLPLPEEFEGQWCAVWARRDDYQEWLDVWGDAPFRIDLFRPDRAIDAGIRDFEAGLIPVDFIDFDQFDEDLVEGEPEDGSQWHDHDQFWTLPTDPEPYDISSAIHWRSKVGGLPRLNGRGHPVKPGMVYAFMLGNDFFDCTFGDAGLLHVWMDPSTGEFDYVLDSA